MRMLARKKLKIETTSSVDTSSSVTSSSSSSISLTAPVVKSPPSARSPASKRSPVVKAEPRPILTHTPVGTSLRTAKGNCIFLAGIDVRLKIQRLKVEGYMCMRILQDRH